MIKRRYARGFASFHPSLRSEARYLKVQHFKMFYFFHRPPTPFFLPPFTYHSLPLPLSSEREGGEKRVISKWGEKEGGSVEGGRGGLG